MQNTKVLEEYIGKPKWNLIVLSKAQDFDGVQLVKPKTMHGKTKITTETPKAYSEHWGRCPKER